MSKITIFLSLLFITSLLSAYSQSADYEIIDKIYDEEIRTARLFPLMDHPDRELMSAAAPIQGNFTLLLQFDHLFAEYEPYYAKFIHCNADWSPSRLFALDYLEDYNEFLIEEYEFSFNTKVPYVHYEFMLPRFKIPGNYLLIVYRESEENIVLTKRFMIYDNQVSLSDAYGNAGIANVSRLNQEIQFNLDYRGRNLDNPQRYIKATIRQNQRWDNAVQLLSPTFVNEASRTMEFRHFAGENQFSASNEFRFFDLNSLRYFGRNVETVDLEKDIPVATLEKDIPRANRGYAENSDYNGKYLIPHPFEADYAYVQFYLQTSQINDDIYLSGDFTQWSNDNTYKLEYVPEIQSYYGVFLMKQGFYNYQYLVESSQLKPNHFEGDHFQTENEYDVMIYYYSFQLDVDLLIGYFTVTKNPRF